MSRRDTIIVAVLINAGLLIVLFASALKSSSDTDLVTAPPSTMQHTPEIAFKKDVPAVLGDEVDQALNQFSQNALAAQPQVAEAAPNAESSSFADDLKMIGQMPAAPQPSEQNPTAHTLLAPVAPQAKTAPDFTEIKVKKGDVLEKIARHHHSTVAEIMKANQLTTTNLRIGQSLKIPNKTIKKAETSQIAHTTPASSSEGGAVYYTVKKGDSPWAIAVKNHLNVEDLLKLNHMSEEQARRLKPGDKLRIQ